MSKHNPEMCGHGIPYKEECYDCDLWWFENVTVPEIKSKVARVIRFRERHPRPTTERLYALLQKAIAPPTAADTKGD